MAAKAPLEALATPLNKGLIAETATGKKDERERRTVKQTATRVLAVSP